MNAAASINWVLEANEWNFSYFKKIDSINTKTVKMLIIIINASIIVYILIHILYCRCIVNFKYYKTILSKLLKHFQIDNIRYNSIAKWIESCNKDPPFIFPLYFPLETHKASVKVSPITYKRIPQRQLEKSSRIVELKRYEKNKMLRKKSSENLSRTILKIAEWKSTSAVRN